MNNQPINFISVKISNFRGVPGVLEVPLDAPLTVIHAANGTGKSTICYALEWLLTGKIEDLSGVTNFSCEWGSGKTEVSAQCMIGEVLYELSREGTSSYIKAENSKRTRIRDSALLDLLTPITVSGNTPQSISKAKRGWLRNSRWLYSNSLALLVDNNQAEERQKIFADILGLGHFSSTLRELREYRSGLPSVKGLEEGVRKLDVEILELENKLLTASPWKVKAAESINEILKYFNVAPKSGSASDNFKIAKIQVNLLSQKVSRELSSFSFIDGNWQQYIDNKTQLDQLKLSISELSQSTWELSQNQTRLSDIIKDAEKRLDEGTRAVSWGNQRLDTFKVWEQLLSNTTITEFFDGNDTNLDKLNKFVEYTWNNDKQQLWLETVDYLVDNATLISHLILQKQQLTHSVVLAPDDLAQISRDLGEAQQKRVKLESEFNALAGILERLKAVGREITKPTSSICPLCHHDWEHPHLLHAELVKEHLTPELTDCINHLENARSTEQKLKLKLDMANVQKVSYENYIKEVRIIDEKLAAIAKRTIYFETMNASDFSDFKVENIQFLQQRIRAAIDLKKLFENLVVTEQSLGLNASQLDLGRRISAAIYKVEEYKSFYHEQANKASSDKDETTKQLSLIFEEIKVKTKDIEGKNAIVFTLTNSISQFEVHWKEVIGEYPLSRDLYNTALEDTRARSAISDSYKQILEEFEAIVSADNHELHIVKLRSNREELNKKLLAGKKYITQADHTIEHYTDFVKEQTSASLSPLLLPASELFSRMHANEVYRKLGVSDTGEAFKWTALADGHGEALDAEEKFSQGQRQDLALSLYLAKACSTGGSFFLDEPIAHLDDLNRVAMLDIFRLLATSKPDMKLVLTTASDGLARHFSQKFSSITDRHLLNIIYLDGNPRTGVKASIRKNIMV
ncbi:AAA family ATPase [Citrobacter braakii]|uniref:AAA family ATPase n=1 Tax=Citrobacter braakii TaxID=57706 RepID=UPI001039EC7D|nr:AAA family ATPase [Citrobacter braakii]TCC86022.1 hypothetical protein EY916_16610 [Citrobacter braakii]